jgi:hypothetical protein
MPTSKLLHIATAAALLGACSAPAIVEPVEPIPPAPAPVKVAAEQTQDSKPLDLNVLDGARWRATGAHDFQLSYRFDGERYTTSGYPAWEESGRVTLLEADGQRLRLSFEKRMFDGKNDDRMDRWIVVADDGASFEMDDMVFRKEPHAATVAGDEIKAAQHP